MEVNVNATCATLSRMSGVTLTRNDTRPTYPASDWQDKPDNDLVFYSLQGDWARSCIVWRREARRRTAAKLVHFSN